MAEKYEEIAVVVDQSSLGNGIYDLTLKTDKIAKAARAGQFVSVYSNDKSKLLPRPISLCGINRDDDTIRLVYRVTGEGTGTEEFSKLVRGDKRLYSTAGKEGISYRRRNRSAAYAAACQGYKCRHCADIG